jgi:16S rRNA (guanine527-N7)-methyltransferase
LNHARAATPTPDELAVLAQALGRPLEAGLTQRLTHYLDLLAHWNGTYNLTAVRTREGMLHQHLADCLAVVAPLARRLEGGPATPRLLDVGSGGGLPGVVLAACLPQLQITCVDTVAKKAAFIRQAAAELQLGNLQAAHARVESLQARPFHVITSRAFASLPDFIRWTQPLLAPGGQWMAMKGKRPDDEIAELPAHVDVFHVEPLQVPGLEAQRCLVWMRPRTPE